MQWGFVVMLHRITHVELPLEIAKAESAALGFDYDQRSLFKVTIEPDWSTYGRAPKCCGERKCYFANSLIKSLIPIPI